MHMAHPPAAGDDRQGEILFLDVHVKQVAEQPDIGNTPALEKCRRIGLPVEEVGLVAIERLVEERLPVAGRADAEVAKRIG